LFIFAGITLARLHAIRPKLTRIAFPLLTLTLAAETLSIYPHFIPFFNRAVGGPDAGAFLLGDSNLDWGQDLPLLAKWPRHNPTPPTHPSPPAPLRPPLHPPDAPSAASPPRSKY